MKTHLELINNRSANSRINNRLKFDAEFMKHFAIRNFNKIKQKKYRPAKNVYNPKLLTLRILYLFAAVYFAHNTR